MINCSALTSLSEFITSPKNTESVRPEIATSAPSVRFINAPGPAEFIDPGLTDAVILVSKTLASLAVPGI